MESDGKMKKLHFVAVILIISMVFAASCSKSDNHELTSASGASRETQLASGDKSDITDTTEESSKQENTENNTDHRYDEPTDGYFFNDYLGLSRNDILSWLKSHETDDYYLGTPYGDEEYGFNTDTCMRPNGRFADNYPHMTCTGFVLDVLMQASGERKEEVQSLASDMMKTCENHGWWNDGPYYRNEVNAYYWGAFIDNYEDGKIYSVKFDTVSDLLTSNLAKKGDIIFFMPDTTVYGRSASGYPCDKYGNPIDCHIGFYWGEDNSGDDLFWHSMTSGLKGTPMDRSLGDFNQISQLTTPSVYTYVLLIPIR